jgi:predicted RNA-binding protein YlqC (UPF0109 family)
MTTPEAEPSVIAALLADVTRAIVDEPEAVEVDELPEDDSSVVFELRVAPDDYGKVIGRGGRTAYALRTVVKVAAAHHDQRVLVDIVDD